MITRRRFALTCASALAAGSVCAANKETSAKKGWCGGDRKMHDIFGAKWYYNWQPSRERDDIEFVPMIKRGDNVNDGAFNKIRSYEGIHSLLGFNEGERKDQGNITVDKAIELWPKLVALAEEKNLRIGSPAPSSDKLGMDWLGAFMDQVKRKKLRVDFVAVHWYRSRDAGQFEDFVKELAKDHRRPVWVTEFNGWSGSEKENYDFLKDSLRFLNRSRDVEKYAYFNPKPSSEHSLVSGAGELTRMGELYRDA